MNCEQASLCIKPFIEGKLEDDQLEEFLDHVGSCKNCYEELDIMFIVSEGLHGLKSDENASFNFTGLLAKRIDQSKRRLLIAKRRRAVNFFLGLIAYAALVLASLRFIEII